MLTLQLELVDTKQQERPKLQSPRTKSRAAWASLRSPLLGATPGIMVGVPGELRGGSEYRLETLGELKRRYRINKMEEDTYQGQCNEHIKNCEERTSVHIRP